MWPERTTTAATAKKAMEKKKKEKEKKKKNEKTTTPPPPVAQVASRPSSPHYHSSLFLFSALAMTQISFSLVITTAVEFSSPLRCYYYYNIFFFIVDSFSDIMSLCVRTRVRDRVCVCVKRSTPLPTTPGKINRLCIITRVS